MRGPGSEKKWQRKNERERGWNNENEGKEKRCKKKQEKKVEWAKKGAGKTKGKLRE